MQVKALGVVQRKGNARATGNPFEMNQLIIISPIKAVTNKNFQQLGYGFESKEYDVMPEMVLQMKDEKFPLDIELETVTIDEGYGLKTIVSSYTVLKPSK